MILKKAKKKFWKYLQKFEKHELKKYFDKELFYDESWDVMCEMWYVMVILFVWCTKDEIDHSHSMTYQVFPTLSDWISSFLKNNSDMTASNIGNNMLVKQVRYHMYMICIRYNRYMLYYIKVLFWLLTLDTCMYFKFNFYVNVVKVVVPTILAFFKELL